MRLWNYELVEKGLLPQSQLIAQWRELNSIFRKQDNNILINYIYEYPKNDLYTYTLMVIKQLKLRGYRINNYNNFYKYFGLEFGKGNTLPVVDIPFKNHHTAEYLEICYYNLKEKYMRGQKDFDRELFSKLYAYIHARILGEVYQEETTVINFFKKAFDIQLHGEYFVDMEGNGYTAHFICITDKSHPNEFLLREVVNDDDYEALKETFENEKIC